MQKKIIAVFLCVVIAFSLCSCSIGTNENIKTFGDAVDSFFQNSFKLISGDSNTATKRNYVEHKDVTPHSSYSQITLTNGYNSLSSDAQKKCYNEMKKAVYNVSNEFANDTDKNYVTDQILLKGTILTNSELRLLITAFCEDNPQVFWLDGKFSYSNDNGNTFLQMYSLLSADELTTYIEKLNSKISQVIASVPSYLSEYSIELFLHDYIINNCDYADDVDKMEDNFNAFTPYGLLVEKTAVCEGYSKTFQLLLSYFGIESVNVVGTGKQELHMWTAVKIDNKWYYVDLTWDDSEEIARYDYFNITTNQLSADHTIAGLFSKYTDEQICGNNGSDPINFNLFVPSCDSNDLNYYVMNAAKLTGFDEYSDSVMIDSLLVAAQKKQSYFHIYVDSDYLNYDNAYTELFGGTHYQFFNYIKQVNSQLGGGYKLDEDSVSIYKKENINVVSVALEYV